MSSHLNLVADRQRALLHRSLNVRPGRGLFGLGDPLGRPGKPVQPRSGVGEDLLQTRMFNVLFLNLNTIFYNQNIF